MTTLLTWETRRWRVFLAKTVAVLAATALFALVVLALVALAMWPALALHGAPLRPDDPTLASLAGTAARGVALATLASGMGLAIATIGRNTAAALGAGFAYIIVFENIIGSFIERWRRWLLLGNVIVFVSGHNDGGDVPGRTVTAAALFLAAVAVTLLAAAASRVPHTRPRLTGRRENAPHGDTFALTEACRCADGADHRDGNVEDVGHRRSRARR